MCGCAAGEAQTEHKAYMADTIDNGAEYSESIDKSRKSRHIPDNSTCGDGGFDVKDYLICQKVESIMKRIKGKEIVFA